MASYKTNEHLCWCKSDVYRWFVDSNRIDSKRKRNVRLGTVRVDDSIKFPIPRFGYPPLKRPQHKFSASYNDLSFTSANPTTQSLNNMTWSNADALHSRPSASQHSNRLQRYAQKSAYDVSKKDES